MSKKTIMPSRENIITFYTKLQTASDDYSEEIAKALLEDKKLLEGIPTITRKNKNGERLLYRKVKSTRQGVPLNPKEDKELTEKEKRRRKEEYLAMDFFNKHNVEKGEKHKQFGFVLDYQTPIGGNEKYLSDDRRISANKISFKKRNIDLISYDEEKDIVYILELKVPESTEPLIRSSIEGYSYLKMLNKKDFIKNMKQIYPQLNISEKTLFRAAPLIYRGCKAAKQYESINDLQYLNQLLKELKITPFIIEE